MKSIMFIFNLVFCFFLVTCSVLGQTLKTWQSPILEHGENADLPHSYLYTDANSHVTTQKVGSDKKGWKLRLNYFSKDFQQLSSIDIPAFIEDMKEIATLKIGNQIVRLQHNFNMGKSMTTIEAMTCNLDGNLSCKSLNLLEVPRKKGIEPMPDLKWAVSPDSTKLLVAVKRRIASSGEISDKPQELYIAVLSTDGGLLWKKDLTLPTPEAEIKLQSWFVTNSGDALLLAELFDKANVDKKREKAERDLAPSRSGLFKLTQADKLPVEIPLREEAENISGCKLQWVDGERLDCACFYSDQAQGNFNGFILASYAIASQKILNEHKVAFDKELLGFFKGYNTEKDKPGLVSTFTFNQIHRQPNGGAILLAANDYDLYFGRYEGYGYSAETRHIRGDIAVFELDEAGLITRKSLFPRAVKFGASDYERTSTTAKYNQGDAITNPLRLMPEDEILSMHKGKICIQYFVSPKDLKRKDSEKAPTFDVAVRALGILDENGQTTITELTDPEKPGKNDAPAPLPKIPFDNPNAYKVYYRGVNARHYYFDVYYISDEVH